MAGKTAKKPRGKPFAAGNNANPNGRPRKTEEQKQATRDALEMLKAAAPDAVALLLRVMQNEDVKLDLRLRCAETVCDRVYGKASQPIVADVGAKVEIVLGGAEELSV